MRFTSSCLLPALATCFLYGASSPTEAKPTFSEYSQMFVNTCLQHAPALSEAAIASSVSKEKFIANSVSVGAGVAMQNGRRCSLRIGGGGNTVSMAAVDEAEMLATWFANRIGGTVKARTSVFGGPLWYEVKDGRKKYEVSVGNQSGVLVFLVALR